jgi:hypothetical protein
MAPATKATIVKIKNKKHRTFEMLAIAPAVEMKPSTAAIMATTKKLRAQDNIFQYSIR